LLEVRRTLVYVAGLGAMLLLARTGSAASIVVAVWAAAALVVVIALARYLLDPGSRFDEGEGALLSWPLGYANAVGVVAAMGSRAAWQRRCDQRRRRPSHSSEQRST
jgi:hypothetical protein